MAKGMLGRMSEWVVGKPPAEAPARRDPEALPTPAQRKELVLGEPPATGRPTAPAQPRPARMSWAFVI
jgi:hypothetical protein